MTWASEKQQLQATLQALSLTHTHTYISQLELVCVMLAGLLLR